MLTIWLDSWRESAGGAYSGTMRAPSRHQRAGGESAERSRRPESGIQAASATPPKMPAKCGGARPTTVNAQSQPEI